MPEFNMARRGLETMQRSHIGSDIRSFSIRLSIWPWPYLAAFAPTFDCEGTYGGGASFKGVMEVIPYLCSEFKNRSVKGTFNFLGKIAEQFPEVVQQAVEKGQDIAGHGYSHINMDGLSREKQLTEFQRTIDAILSATGRVIRGWRCPWGTYDRTTYELMMELGFTWASNWSRSLWGSDPFHPMIDGKRFSLVEVPFDDVHFDAQLYGKLNLPVKNVIPLWYNYAVRAIQKNGLYVLLNHPVQLVLDWERVEALLELVERIRALGKVWLCSCGQVAARVATVESISKSLDCHLAGEGATISYQLVNTGSEVVDDLSLIVDIPDEVEGIRPTMEHWICDLNLRRRVYVRLPRLDPGATTNGQIVVDIA
jgi:peptidoglycan/xylan/chitin deacetylase (PgdA/CDA1 family)